MRNPNNYLLLRAVLITGLSLFLAAGCSKKEQQSAPASQQSEKPVVKIKPAVQKQSSSAKINENLLPEFNFSAKKDPFKAFVAESPPTKARIATAKGSDTLPIQRYEVRKFKVAGIIAGLKENRALIIDPAGKGYVVKQGMPIGDGDGRITRITSTFIEILEQYKEDTGRVRKRTIKLTLPQKSKETSR
ncbi:MAG: pilus assembly protein PilP [Geobacteraceae bacterium]